MKNTLDNYILFSCILDYGKGTKALDISKEYGAIKGTVFLGRGTVRDHWLNILGATDLRKEIFITILNEKDENEFYDVMSKKFSLDKPNHGIAFSIPLKSFTKISERRYESSIVKRGENSMDYECVFTIVDKGLSGSVLDAAESVGSTGGTVIHGRGTGSQEKATLFDIKIEPEKDIVLILSRANKADAIVTAIEESLEINKPGKGIVFVIDVSRTLGLYKGS